MTFLQTDKMKLSVLVVSFLLLVSAFTFLPAVGAITPTTVANTSSAPATVIGATATIDYPILAGYSAVINRTVTLTNPIGNPAISTFTISIPKAAASTTPYGYISSGTTGTVQTYGTGPWAIVYTATGGSTGTLVPGGAAVTLTFGFTTETTYASTAHVADAYTLSTSVTDTTGAASNLPSITIYECSSTQPTVTAAVGTLIAGTPFTVTVMGSDSGLPLTVTTAASVSNKSDTNRASTTTTLSPSSYTTGTYTASQSVSVNDTTAETLYVAVVGGTPAATSLSQAHEVAGSGLLTGNSTAMTINAGPITGLAIKVNSIASTKIVNLTTSQAPGNVISPIPGSNITVSTADKYGNPVISGGTTTVTLTADTFLGQSAGFNGSDTSLTYGTPYPFTPSTAVTTSITLTIASGHSSVSPAGVYFFGIDYGSQSQLVATSSSGLATGTSAMIYTYALSSTAISVFPGSNVNVKAGSSQTVNATLGIAQKNVPIAFGFSSVTTYKGSYASTGTNFTQQYTTVNSANQGVASASVVVATKLNSAINVNATETLAPKVSATAVVSAGQLVTTAGALSTLTVLPYFAAASGSQTMATNVVPSASVYLNITASDAYGNLKTVSGNTQLSLSASAGTLSITIPVITSGQSSTNASGVSILYVAPSTIGTVATITATGVASGVSVTGSATLTVVSKTPLLSATGPSTWTSGIPSSITGTTNASTGINNNKIVSLQYTVNGGTAQPIAFTSAANVAFSFTVLLTGASNINITVKDSAGNTNWMIVQVPPVATTGSFTFPKAPAQTTLSSYSAVAVNVTNNQPSSLTAVVFVSVANSAGQTVGIFTSTVNNLGPTASTVAYVVLNGLAHGTYTASIFVLSTSGVPLSQPTTLSVTV